MPELKTLKELKGRILPMTGEKGKPINQVSTDILKEEAIKWIKAIRNAKFVSSTSIVAGEDIVTIVFGDGKEKKVTTKQAALFQELSFYKEGKVDLWIVDFFNITKKDMK